MTTPEIPAATNGTTRPEMPLPFPLTMPRRSIAAIVADLSKPLPHDCIASKAQGGSTIPYLHWQTVARVLDVYAPGWRGEVVRLDPVGQACAITYRITIPAAEGDVWREATGQEDEDLKGYGDSTSNAEAMAMKRAAAKFGVGLHLYDKDGTAPALAKHLQQEVLATWKAFGLALDASGRDRTQTLQWLYRVTGASTKREVPLSALKAVLGQLTQAEEPTHV